MTKAIWSIFKIVIMIPILVFIAYMIFNLIAFVVCYFRVVGAYQAAQNIAMENNYIPPSEEAQLYAYFGRLEIGNYSEELNAYRDVSVLSNIKLTDNTNTTSTGGGRVQYGTEVTVGVEAIFTIVLPLMPHDMIPEGTNVASFNALGNYGYSGSSPSTTQGDRLSDSELESKRKNKFTIEIPIVLESQVPGLRYYADLE